MAAGQHVDLLSQMQAELHRMSELLFSTVGELQRDALPARVNSEELIRGTSSSYNAAERSKGFAAELVQASMNMKLLVSKLPSPPGTEEEQMARIREMQQRNLQLHADLAAEQKVAQRKLEEAQDLFALVARHELSSSMAMPVD